MLVALLVLVASCSQVGISEKYVAAQDYTAVAKSFAAEVYDMVSASGFGAFRSVSAFNGHESTMSLTAADAASRAARSFPCLSSARSLESAPLEAYFYVPGLTGIAESEAAFVALDLSAYDKWAVGVAPSIESDDFQNIEVRMNTGEVVPISAWDKPEYPVIVVGRGGQTDAAISQIQARGTSTTLQIDYLCYTFPTYMDPFYEPKPEIYSNLCEDNMAIGTLTGGQIGAANPLNPKGANLQSGSILSTDNQILPVAVSVYETDLLPSKVTIQFRDRDGLFCDPTAKNTEDEYLDDDMGQMKDISFSTLSDATKIYATTSSLTDDNGNTDATTVKTKFRLHY